MPTATPQAQGSAYASITAEIEALGCTWTLEPSYKLEQIKDRSQVREEKHVAPKSEVARYMQALKAGATFAPIVVSDDDLIIDGNTRRAAAEASDRHDLPALIVTTPTVWTVEERERKLDALGATLNAKNGNPLDRAEYRKAARNMIALGWKLNEIAGRLGMKPGTLAGLRFEMTAEEKLVKTGVNVNGSRGPVLRALGKVADVNDDPFRELATFTLDAGLNAAEVADLAKRIRETGSDGAALQIVEEERKQQASRIANRKLTGKADPPASRKLRQTLGFVVQFEASPNALVETNPEYATAHVATLKQAVKVLEAALAEQAKIGGDSA